MEKEERPQLVDLYLEELQSSAKDLPIDLQQRCPHELLASLADSLLDGTVLEIIHGLQEIQQMTEKDLFNARSQVVSRHRADKSQLMKLHRDTLHDYKIRPNQKMSIPQLQSKHQADLKAFEAQCEVELKNEDFKIIKELDQLVTQQQSVLQKAGVPGFYVTSNPQEIRLQMFLFDFLLKLDLKFHPKETESDERIPPDRLNPF